MLVSNRVQWKCCNKKLKIERGLVQVGSNPGFCQMSSGLTPRQTSDITATCTVLTILPHFVMPKFRSWRACFYAGFGLGPIIFVAHGLVSYGWKVQKSRMSLV